MKTTNKLRVTNPDWTTKRLPVTNRAIKKTRPLKNGKVVPTWEYMKHKAARI